MKRSIFGIVVATALAGASTAWGAAPTLYADKFREGPVRGEATELLLVPGAGMASADRLVFRRFNGAPPPLDVPVSDTGDWFRCTTASAFCRIKQRHDAGVVVELPATFASGQRYQVFALTNLNEKSNATVIGDGRPLWTSPGFVYSSAQRAGLAREVRIVGRNLDRAGAVATSVRFTQCFVASPTTFDRNATVDVTPTGKYVARVDLANVSPPVGLYAVSVKRGSATDYVGQSCTTTEREDMFEVRATPAAASAYVAPCTPNDGLDDTACIVNAIATAKTMAGASGSTDVVFSPGEYNLDPATPIGSITLPPRVGLRGPAGATARIVKHASWNPEGAKACPQVCIDTMSSDHPWCDGVRDYHAVFRIFPDPASPTVSRNTIQNLIFEDKSTTNGQPFGHSVYETSTFFSIESEPVNGAPSRVREITFTRNAFVGVGNGVYTKGWVEDLVFTHNDVTADIVGLLFGPSGQLALNANWSHEQVRDAVIRENTFHPGRYGDVAYHQGSMTMALGGATRIDVSDNDALNDDGEYLDTDETGWRAGLFFHLSNNVEKALVSGNVFECTGSKGGDGEGIALDSNQDQYPFRNAKRVVAATASTIEVELGTDGFTKPESFFKEHWVRVGSGTGLGQVRKITAVALSNPPTGPRAVFTVSPAWEVRPTGSNVMFGRQYWQMLLLGNTIDNEGCPLNDDYTKYNTGDMGMGTTSDSVIEGNNQIATEGITLIPTYGVQNRADCSYPVTYVPGQPLPAPFVSMVSFYNLLVRGNILDGEGMAASRASNGGIAVIGISTVVGPNCVPTTDPPAPVMCNGGSEANIAACDPRPIPVTLVFGLDIARNRVRNADTSKASMIALSRYAEPWADPAGSLPYAVLPLVQHNVLSQAPTGNLHGTSTLPYTFTYETADTATCNPFDTVPVTAAYEETVRQRGIGIAADRLSLSACAASTHVPPLKATVLGNLTDASITLPVKDCSTP